MRLDFGAPLSSVESLQQKMLGWLARARERAGDDCAPTSIERELARLTGYWRRP